MCEILYDRGDKVFERMNDQILKETTENIVQPGQSN
jgi:hypothetical protein